MPRKSGYGVSFVNGIATTTPTDDDMRFFVQAVQKKAEAVKKVQPRVSTNCRAEVNAKAQIASEAQKEACWTCRTSDGMYDLLGLLGLSQPPINDRSRR